MDVLTEAAALFEKKNAMPILPVDDQAVLLRSYGSTLCLNPFCAFPAEARLEKEFEEMAAWLAILIGPLCTRHTRVCVELSGIFVVAGESLLRRHCSRSHESSPPERCTITRLHGETGLR